MPHTSNDMIIVPIAPLRNFIVPAMWVGTSTSIFVPFFGSEVMVRCANVFFVKPATLSTGPMSWMRSVM